MKLHLLFTSLALAVAAAEPDFGPYRLRTGDDAVWPPVERAYGGKIFKITEGKTWPRTSHATHVTEFKV